MIVKRTFYFIVFVVTIISGCEKNKLAEGVFVTTDKSEYQKWDTVFVNILNNTPDTVFLHYNHCGWIYEAWAWARTSTYIDNAWVEEDVWRACPAYLVPGSFWSAISPYEQIVQKEIINLTGRIHMHFIFLIDHDTAYIKSNEVLVR